MKINILKDEGLQEICKPFISGLLPHENYDPVVFTEILQSIYSFIKLEEFSGPYYVILKILDDLNKLKSRFEEYIPSLTRDTLERILQMSVDEAILAEEVDMRYILDHEGLNSDLNIETTKDVACQKLYAMTLELYDECFELKFESLSVLDQVPALEAAFIAHISQESINTQALILQGNTRINNKIYAGSLDWFQYLQRFTLDVQNRLNQANNSTKKISTLEQGISLLDTLKTFSEPLADYGIPELDRNADGTIATPMLKHRLVVVIGAVNIGKSMFCIDKCVNLLLNGKKVIYMYGETAEAKIYAQILVCYIKKKYSISLKTEHLATLDECPEHVQKVAMMAIHELLDLLILKDKYNYFNLYEQLRADYEAYKFDAVFFDHSYALDGLTAKDNGKSSIDALAVNLRDFKKRYPVYLCVASHPSTTARDAMARNKEVVDSPTKGSMNLYAEADDCFLLKSFENLEKAGQVALVNMKRRDASVIKDPVVLLKNFAFYQFKYDASLQVSSTGVDLSAEEALQDLENNYGDQDAYELSGY